jgi:anthranilate phosphoribosyltransferase
MRYVPEARGDLTGPLDAILGGQTLDTDGAERLMHALTDAEADPRVAAAVLAGLRARGETGTELVGFARAMRALARRPPIPRGRPLLDVVGTGGDGSGSLNISTGVALLTAACGQPVVKHGNRAVSSRSGSADVLEKLGLPLPLDETAAARCLEQLGFTFLYAPHYHPSMKAIAGVRRALGVRTVFNLLGPLTNPAEPELLLMGAYDRAAARLLAEALSGLPIIRAFVVHGEPGWDEATTAGPFLLLDVRPGTVAEAIGTPEAFGLPRAPADALLGADAEHNAAAMRRAFAGEEGAFRDTLLLGASLALQLAGTAPTPREGVEIARAALADGRASRLLERIGASGSSEGAA